MPLMESWAKDESENEGTATTLGAFVTSDVARWGGAGFGIVGWYCSTPL